MWINSEGNYQGFRATRTDYRAYGPCLTDVGYVEETIGGEILSRVNVSIGRTDDYLRTFHHLRYDVRKPVQWQRLAFYQLGADFYNDTPARRVAIGNAAGLLDEWEPNRAKEIYDRRNVALVGDEPWVSIHGVERSAMNKGGAIASRGLIVRSWKAVLGGKQITHPNVSFYSTEWGKGNFRTVIELSPPPGLTTLKAGDFAEAEVELVVFPAESQTYYGPNTAFRKALETEADTWRFVQREAAGNRLQVQLRQGKLDRNYPLMLSVDRKERAACAVAGGIGYVPVTFNGLNDYRQFELFVDGHPLNQVVHGNDFWQTDYDEVHKQWRLTYNILRDGQGQSSLELRKRSRSELIKQ